MGASAPHRARRDVPASPCAKRPTAVRELVGKGAACSAREATADRRIGGVAAEFYASGDASGRLNVRFADSRDGWIYGGSLYRSARRDPASSRLEPAFLVHPRRRRYLAQAVPSRLPEWLDLRPRGRRRNGASALAERRRCRHRRQLSRHARPLARHVSGGRSPEFRRRRRGLGRDRLARHDRLGDRGQ